MFIERLIGRHRVIKGSETYITPENRKVKLYSREIQPRGNKLEEAPGQLTGIIYYTAWAMPTWVNTALAQELADMSGVTTTIIKISADPRYIQQIEGAEAARRFIEKKGYTNVTLVGNSQSGITVAETVPLLRKNNPDIYINGGVELGSMGLSDQNEEFIANVFTPSKGKEQAGGDGQSQPGESDNFTDESGYVPKPNKLDQWLNDPGSHFFDRFFNDPNADIIWHPIKNRKIWRRALRMNSGVVLDLIKQVFHAHGNIYRGVENQRGEMIRKSPAFKEADVPFVFINGEADTMSPPNGIISKHLGIAGARAHIRRLFEYQKKVKDALPPDSKYDFMSDPKYMDPANKDLKGVTADREHQVHDTLVPASEGNRVIIADADNAGHHALAVYRPRTVARAALAALERLNRRRREFQSKEEKADYLRDRSRFTQPPQAQK